MKYDVDLHYPKQTRQPVYSVRCEAISETQALAHAKRYAGEDGWRGQPLKHKVHQVREQPPEDV
ncbi:hypothetical protein [Pseudomonas pseudonitroreducens]|uniref:hypothetical protein n=1 Tax=Pseudomonas pseudonitroreducens TaxID=2892326 RepID=UPI001F1F0D77|nr:hypothetical protein [Pseudomonas pseudonitroreducens]